MPHAIFIETDVDGQGLVGAYAAELSFVRERLAASETPHWKAYLAAWDALAAA